MPDARALKAVVCDYDSWNLRVLTASVVDAGYEVLGETTNAVETIRLTELLHPTLVVITQEQNGMSAIDALPALRALDDAPEVLIVAIDPGIRTTAKAAGAFDVAPRADPDMLQRQLSEVRELLETGERRSSKDRRSGMERRQKQDWSKVTAERRSGTDRRGGLRREKDVTTMARDALRQARTPAARVDQAQPEPVPEPVPGPLPMRRTASAQGPA